MNKGFGIAALVIAIIAIFIPVVGIFFSGAGLILAAIAALAGDRAFAVATLLIAGVNTFFMSPSVWAALAGSGRWSRARSRARSVREPCGPVARPWSPAGYAVHPAHVALDSANRGRGRRRDRGVASRALGAHRSPSPPRGAAHARGLRAGVSPHRLGCGFRRGCALASPSAKDGAMRCTRTPGSAAG